MDSMIERVARAIMPTPCDATGGSHSVMAEGRYQFCTHCGETITKSRDLTFTQAMVVARAAIAAMREPTEAMWQATKPVLSTSTGYIDRDDFMAAFQAMIDSALKEGE